MTDQSISATNWQIASSLTGVPATTKRFISLEDDELGLPALNPKPELFHMTLMCFKVEPWRAFFTCQHKTLLNLLNREDKVISPYCSSILSSFVWEKVLLPLILPLRFLNSIDVMPSHQPTYSHQKWSSDVGLLCSEEIVTSPNCLGFIRNK